jgi:hypothetical protein
MNTIESVLNTIESVPKLVYTFNLYLGRTRTVYTILLVYTCTLYWGRTRTVCTVLLVYTCTLYLGRTRTVLPSVAGRCVRGKLSTLMYHVFVSRRPSRPASITAVMFRSLMARRNSDGIGLADFGLTSCAGGECTVGASRS